MALPAIVPDDQFNLLIFQSQLLNKAAVLHDACPLEYHSFKLPDLIALVILLGLS